MALGVDKILEVVADAEVLLVSGIVIVKDCMDGVSFGDVIANMSRLAAVGKSIDELRKDIPAALPELKDLDAAEVARIGSAGYVLVQKVIEAIRKK